MADLDSVNLVVCQVTRLLHVFQALWSGAFVLGPQWWQAVSIEVSKMAHLFHMVWVENEVSVSGNSFCANGHTAHRSCF